MSNERIDSERRRITRLMVWGSTAAAIAWSGLAEAADGINPAVVVKATDDLQFVPDKVTIKVGDTVRWQSASVMVHTVTCDPAKAARPLDAALPEGAQPFDSGNIEPQGSFEHRFTVPGTYKYFCIPHEGADMLGEVIVKP